MNWRSYLSKKIWLPIISLATLIFFFALIPPNLQPLPGGKNTTLEVLGGMAFDSAVQIPFYAPFASKGIGVNGKIYLQQADSLPYIEKNSAALKMLTWADSNSVSTGYATPTYVIGNSVGSVTLQGGSPLFSVTPSGGARNVTWNFSINAQSPNQVWVGPATGTVNATPTYRSLVPADLPSAFSPNNQNGTTYTFALSDAGGFVSSSNTSAVTWTIPTHASVAFATNTYIRLININSGKLTIVAAGGVTLNSNGAGAFSLTQGAAAFLWQTATDTWQLSGNISP